MELGRIILGVFLTASAVIDLKYRAVSVKMLLAFGSIGFALFVVAEPFSVADMLGGVLIGVVVVVLHHFTHGEIGDGDGYLLMVTGLYLGTARNIQLAVVGLLFAALWSVFLIVVKRVPYKSEIPFVPSLLLSFVMLSFQSWGKL